MNFFELEHEATPGPFEAIAASVLDSESCVPVASFECPDITLQSMQANARLFVHCRTHFKEALLALKNCAYNMPHAERCDHRDGLSVCNCRLGQLEKLIAEMEEVK